MENEASRERKESWREGGAGWAQAERLCSRWQSALWWGLVLGVWVWPLRWGWADCFRLYRQQRYSRAGSCFASQAEKLGTAREARLRVRKGRLLRNAALCWEKAAQSAKSGEAAVLRMRAVKSLTLLLEERLHESGERRAAMVKLRERIRRSVGLASVSVVTGSERARSCLRTEGWRRCERGAVWNLKVLPRRYTLEVRFAPTGRPETRTLEARPFGRHSLVVTRQAHDGWTTVVTNHPRAVLTITGAAQKKPLVARGTVWSGRLAPGAYQLQVVYPNASTVRRTLQVKKGKPGAVVLQPPGPPRLVLHTTPLHARVYVDGVFRGNTSLRLRLRPGVHRISLRRGCFQRIERTITAKPNKEQTLSFVLQRDPVYVGWLRGKKGAGRWSAIGWSTLAAGAVIAGVGGVMHGLASDRHGQAGVQRPVNFDGYQQLAVEGNTFRAIGYVGLGLGVVGLGVGVGALVKSRPISRFRLPCKEPLAPTNDDL